MNIGTTAGPGGRRRLVLIRHAETAENVAGRFLGRSDPSPTPDGVAAAARLAPAFGPTAGSLVVTSPARRARETAGALGLGEPLVDDAFREVDFGDWEGLTQDEVAARDPEGFASFARGDIAGFPGGETIAAARDRAVDAVDRHRADRLVVVTHATLVRALVAGLLGLPVERYRSLLGRPANLSWTELESTADGWMLVTYGSVPGPGAGAR
jgi:broad specificity phosphatase PhoE